MPKPLDLKGRSELRRGRPRPSGTGRLTAVAVLGVQVAVLLLAESLRPAAAAVPPDPFWDTLGAILAAGYLIALVTALAALDTPRVSLRASGSAAGVAVVMTLGCPASGHHVLGGWFVTELALVGLGLAVAAYGYRRLG